MILSLQPKTFTREMHQASKYHETQIYPEATQLRVLFYGLIGLVLSEGGRRILLYGLDSSHLVSPIPLSL